MSMFDKLGAPPEKRVAPAGVTVGKVLKVQVDEEKGRVSLNYHFPQYKAYDWSNHYLFKKNGEENTFETDALFRMFKAIGIDIKSKSEFEFAFNSLVDNWFNVEITTKNDYRNFKILSRATPPERAERQQDDSDDLPF